MFKELMHNLIGNSGAQGMVSTTGIGASQLTASMQNSILRQGAARNSANKRVFQGNIEVQQVANGYVVNIGTKEGYEYTTHIAHTIVEVNEIIAAAMVAFQLENT
jgi:hypothetical protein